MILCPLNKTVGFDRSTVSRHAVPCWDVRRHWRARIGQCAQWTKANNFPLA